MQEEFTEQKKSIVTCIGDSTIDNKIWVDGLIASYIKTRLGIERDKPTERIEKAHNNLLKPSLSVIENLMDLLPNHQVYDYTNDGFTTRDVLRGNFKDKVFPTGAFSSFPSEFFKPLAAAGEAIQSSQHIILSVGGNNFREFLMSANEKSKEERNTYIQENFTSIFTKMYDEYIDIIKQIRTLNQDAQIILMTQYYPSASQKTYKIYEFMHEIGKILEVGGPSHDPMTVIHAIMKVTYTEVFKRISEEKIPNIVVADVTSSLNPFDKNNHVSQIEPSGIGGKKIAQMLKFIITNPLIKSGNAYRFLPDFFNITNDDKDHNFTVTPLASWIPVHPNALKVNSNNDEIFNDSDLYLLFRLADHNTKNADKIPSSIFKFLNSKDRFQILLDKIKAVVVSYAESQADDVKKESLKKCLRFIESKGFLSIYSMDTPGFQTEYQTEIDRLNTILKPLSEDGQASLLTKIYNCYISWEKTKQAETEDKPELNSPNVYN